MLRVRDVGRLLAAEDEGAAGKPVRDVDSVRDASTVPARQAEQLSTRRPEALLIAGHKLRLVHKAKLDNGLLRVRAA